MLLFFIILCTRLSKAMTSKIKVVIFEFDPTECNNGPFDNNKNAYFFRPNRNLRKKI